MSRAPSERWEPQGMSVLRVDERLVEELAEIIAVPVVACLRPRMESASAFLDAAGAARHLCTSRKRIHELTSARTLRPDGYDGRRPLYRRASLDRYVEGGAGR